MPVSQNEQDKIKVIGDTIHYDNEAVALLIVPTGTTRDRFISAIQDSFEAALTAAFAAGQKEGHRQGHAQGYSEGLAEGKASA